MNFLKDWKDNKEYFSLLELMARLSNLFSDSAVPFLHYRITENLFCKFFDAENLSRSDTAYDAKKDSFGVGIKTFTLKNNESTEKVAEFNSISTELKKYRGYDLAYQLANARNERMQFGQRLYSITDGCYHIIGRTESKLIVFNSPYPFLNVEKLHIQKDDSRSLRFDDGRETYTFNYSKSTLFKHFSVLENQDVQEIPVSIIQDPYEILRKLIDTQDNEGKYTDIYNVHRIIRSDIQRQKKLKLGENYVILPLYSQRKKDVAPKSGLNQWNAGGRARSADEVYIPVPLSVHHDFPQFFPPREKSFTLHLPDGTSMSAKICQDGGKALMSNPNTVLGKWLLRDILHLKEGELLTMDKLNFFGFDSVIITKINDDNFKIDVRREKNDFE